MKNLMKLMIVLVLSVFSIACKSPSATGVETAPEDTVTDTTTSTDAAGNTTTTSTAADGTITTTITSADGTSVTTVALPADVNNLGSAGGVWRGTFTADNGGETTFYKVSISPARDVVMLSASGSSLEIQGGDMLQSTSYVQTSEAITINLQEYVKENDGTPPVDVVMVGNLTPLDNMRGTYTRGAETGSFVFIYDPIFENDENPFFYTQNSTWELSKAIAGGTYRVTFGILDPLMVSIASPLVPTVAAPLSENVSTTIEAEIVTMPPVDGVGVCSYNGNIAVVSPLSIIYDMTMEVTGCALAGTYTGLATLEERFSLDNHPHDHYNFMTFVD